jgi:peptide/histidine transporter 3/4
MFTANCSYDVSSANNCFQCTAFFGVSTNLVNYFKDRLHQGSKAAANGVTNFQGTSSITPLVAAFIADAFLGRYWTIAVFLLVSVVVSTRNSRRRVYRA